jgi:hypothetical protein
MRFIVVPILLVLVLSQSFSHWFVVLAFNINRDYIAKNLCENRYRPKMHCNGNCVLMRKLKEKEKEEQNQPAAKSEISIIVLSSKTYFPNILPPVHMQSATVYQDFTEVKTVDRSFAFFHPPQA